MIFKRINAVFNPECYHGWGIDKRFFEGWYFKIISSDQNFAYAFITGVAMDKRVEESMDSIIHITLYNKKNNEELFSEKGTSAAIEVAGKYRQLLK
tara:strand:+ start:43 stop:330 length:288 start_codon:yes stop_codon:yes gene_type:complete